MNDQELEELYRRANAEDPARPSGTGRQAILAEAARVASEIKPASVRGSGPSASSWRGLLHAWWRTAAVGSFAAAAIAAVMVTAVFRLAPPPVTSGAPIGATQPSATPSASKPSTAPEPSVGRTITDVVNTHVQRPPGEIPQAVPPPETVNSPSAAVSSDESAPRTAAPAAPAAARADVAQIAEARARPAQTALAVEGGFRASDAAQGLLEAATAGDTARIEALIAANAPLEARDEKGRTALMLAALYGHARVLTTLLRHGADPNAEDSAGRTPLEVARQRNAPDVVAALRKAGGH